MLTQVGSMLIAKTVKPNWLREPKRNASLFTEDVFYEDSAVVCETDKTTVERSIPERRK
jgi:hypothetical protein